MRPTILAVLTIGVLLTALTGCIPSEPTAKEGNRDAQVNPQALLDEWRSLAKEPSRNLRNPRTREIARQLSQIDRKALLTILDILEAPEAEPLDKVFVVVTLDTVVGEDMTARLKELSAPDRDGTSRACAVQLLGLSGDEEVLPYLLGLVEDSEPRVAFGAQLGAATLGSEQARAALKARYVEERCRPEERDKIVRLLSVSPRPDDMAILIAGVSDTAIDPSARIQAALTLGRMGNREALPALDQCAREAANEDLKALAQAAARAIRERYPADHNETADDEDAGPADAAGDAAPS